jgi:hypothetical protein
MNKIKYMIGAAVATLVLALGVAMPAVVSAKNDKPEKVNLCHQTGSEKNPFVVQSVNANQVESHLGNGDFLYNGPLKDNGHPDQKAGKEWCENNQPGDKCANVDGKQTEVPAGQVVDANGNCVAAPAPQVLAAQVTVKPVSGVSAGGGGGSTPSTAATLGLVGSVVTLGLGLLFRRKWTV